MIVVKNIRRFRARIWQLIYDSDIKKIHKISQKLRNLNQDVLFWTSLNRTIKWKQFSIMIYICGASAVTIIFVIFNSQVWRKVVEQFKQILSIMKTYEQFQIIRKSIIEKRRVLMFYSNSLMTSYLVHFGRSLDFN